MGKKEQIHVGFEVVLEMFVCWHRSDKQDILPSQMSEGDDDSKNNEKTLDTGGNPCVLGLEALTIDRLDIVQQTSRGRKSRTLRRRKSKTTTHAPQEEVVFHHED